MKDNWEYKSIEDCFDYIKNGANIRQFKDASGIPITRIETLSNGIFNRNRMGFADITDISKYEANILHDGDLLMSHINSGKYLGRTVMYSALPNEVFIHGMNLLRLIPNNSILSKYFSYFTNSFYFKSKIEKIRKDAVNQSSFSISDLKKIYIPVPPKTVQEQIIAELDKLNEMIETRKEQLKELDNLAQSLFYDTFGDPIFNPKGWKTEQFEKCITKVKYPTKLQTSDYRLCGQYPIISQDDSLISGYTDREDCIFNINSPIVIFGDHTRVLKYVPFSFALGADGVKILYPSSIILARYLFFCILLSKIPSLGYSRHYKLLKELQIPIPPLPLQQQFASQVEAIERQKELVEASIAELQTLLDSRMDYWFN